MISIYCLEEGCPKNNLCSMASLAACCFLLLQTLKVTSQLAVWWVVFPLKPCYAYFLILCRWITVYVHSYEREEIRQVHASSYQATVILLLDTWASKKDWVQLHEDSFWQNLKPYPSSKNLGNQIVLSSHSGVWTTFYCLQSPEHKGVSNLI